MKYFLEIRNENGGRELKAFAFGTAAQINFVGRQNVAELLEDAAGSYSYRLLQVEYIGQDIEGDGIKVLGKITGADGETVGATLKRKLATLKKEAGAEPLAE